MRVLVFAGGDPISPQRIRELGSVDLIIAADSGAEAAVAAGLNVDVLVGDLDSISPATLENVHNLGTAIEAHAPDKDATDLELAILSAQDRGATAVTVVGGGGGHLDHLLGNVAVVASPRFRMVQVTWVLAEETSYPVHRDRQIAVEPGTDAQPDRHRRRRPRRDPFRCPVAAGGRHASERRLTRHQQRRHRAHR